MIQELIEKPLYIQINFGLLAGSALFIVVLTLVQCFRRSVCGAGCPPSMWKLPEVPIFRGSNFPIAADYALMLFYVLISALFIGSSCLQLDAAAPAEAAGEQQVDIITVWLNVIFNFAMYLPLIIRYAIISKFRCDIRFSSLAKTILALGIIYTLNIALNCCGVLKWIAEATGSPETQHAIQQITQESGSAASILPLIVSAVIVAPIVEEIFFRGFIYNLLKKLTVIPVAAIASGIFFGAVHISLVQCTVLSIFGIVQCFLYEHTRSILYPILLHMIFNGLAMTALFLLQLS